MDISLQQQDFNDTITDNKFVLIDFYADWCGPCQVLLPTVEKLASEYSDSIAIKKVNVDANRELAASFGVRSIPTLVYLFKGKEIGRQNGLISEQQLRAQLDQLKTAQ